jgi:hypothetical protein
MTAWETIPMARDSGGTMTYDAPGGNVVDGTAGTAAWANSTLNQISTEITDSLSRSGKGGMTAALKVADGSVGSPSYTFTNDSGMGLYRSASGEISGTAGGSAIWKWTTSGFFASLLQSLTAVTLRLLGRMVDGASAVGVVLDTANTYSTTGAKLVSFRNNTSEKAYIDKDGIVSAAGLTVSADITATNTAKAFALITTKTVTHGFNVASVSDASTNEVTVNFTSALASANYAVVIGDHNTTASDLYLLRVKNRTVNGFDVAGVRNSDDAVLNLQSLGSAVYSVAVFY